MLTVSLDCQACKKEKSMMSVSISKFGGLIRVIGWILALPSIISIALAVSYLIYAIVGQYNPAAVLIMFGTWVALSLVSGLIGYLLISKKKVWKCTYCGFVMDRA